jgi:hypothetical protein
MKRWVPAFLITALLLCGQALANPQPSLSIKGLVEQPLILTMRDLAIFQSVSVQLNEVRKDGSYHGAFFYRGVPLRDLLQAARIQLKRENFFKGIDLALAVRNKDGTQVVLSWGEVFYRNPGTVLIALSAQPIMPHGDCKSCHTPEVYRRWLDPLKREVGLPKLLMGGDTWSDRSLDDVTEIEILDLSPDLLTRKMEALFSPDFEVSGPGLAPVRVSDLGPFPRTQSVTNQIGQGKGYHGTKATAGASFKSLMERFFPNLHLSGVFLVSAPDGYRSILSYGELFLSPAGERVVLADTINESPITENGKFIMIPPDDLMADRWVKAVHKIEWIPLPHK